MRDRYLRDPRGSPAIERCCQDRQSGRDNADARSIFARPTWVASDRCCQRSPVRSRQRSRPRGSPANPIPRKTGPAGRKRWKPGTASRRSRAFDTRAHVGRKRRMPIAPRGERRCDRAMIGDCHDLPRQPTGGPELGQRRRLSRHASQPTAGHELGPTSSEPSCVPGSRSWTSVSAGRRIARSWTSVSVSERATIPAPAHRRRLPHRAATAASLRSQECSVCRRWHAELRRYASCSRARA